ncbi:MAG: hypothetical protein ACRDVG_06625 [Jatrophihabitantaceae bacterium]
MGYPPPPPPPPGPPGPPGRQARLRGHTGMRVGIALTVPGLILLIVGIVVIATQSFTKVDGFQRVSFAQGTGTIDFSKSGDYVAYYEAPGVNSGISLVPAILLSLRDHGTDAPVTLTPYGNNADGRLDKLTYSYHGHHGVAFREFHIATPGAYGVILRGGPGVDPSGGVAFGESIATGTIVGALLVLVGIGLLVAGVVLIIVAAVRRRGHKKQLAAGYAAGYGWPQNPWPPRA